MDLGIRAVFGLLSVTILFVACIEAQESEAPASNDKSECIRKFIQWCDDMEYDQGHGVSIVSLSYYDEAGYNRVFCSSDSDGTNCTRNGSPWYACTPEHTLTYKGQVLSDPEQDVDDDVCKTADKAINQLSFRKFTLDNETLTNLQREWESFSKAMAAMRTQLQELQKGLGGAFMGDDFWGGFGDFFSRRPDSEIENDNNQQAKKDSNQIERE